MSLEQRFGTVKPVIAMVHFPGLPGRPRHDREAGRRRLVDVVGRDLEVLQDAGVDAVLFCNEADIPYQLVVGPEIPAAMAAVIGELRSSIRVPFGVNILWDAHASLALARATGATFIREVLTGVYECDLGVISPSLGELAGLPRRDRRLGRRRSSATSPPSSAARSAPAASPSGPAARASWASTRSSSAGPRRACRSR